MAAKLIDLVGSYIEYVRLLNEGADGLAKAVTEQSTVKVNEVKAGLAPVNGSVPETTF